MTTLTVSKGQGNLNSTYLWTVARARFDPKWPLSYAGAESPLSPVFFHFDPEKTPRGFNCEARSKVGERRHSTALVLVRPRLPPGRGDPRPSQRRPQSHRTCWGRARGSFVSPRLRGEGKGTKCDKWCHFPHGRAKDRSNPGRSLGPVLKRGRAICARGAPEEDQPPPRSPKAGNDVSASRARGPERGVEEALLGEVPRVREPGCSCSPSGPHSPNRGAELALESRCQGVTRKQKLSPAGPSVYRMQSTTRKGACAPTTVRRRDATAQTPEAASSLLRPS